MIRVREIKRIMALMLVMMLCLSGCGKAINTFEKNKDTTGNQSSVEVVEYTMDELDGELTSMIAKIYSDYLENTKYLTKEEIIQQKDEILTKICDEYKIPYETKIRVRGKAYTDEKGSFYLLYNEVNKDDVININTEIMADEYGINYDEMIGEKNSFGLLCHFENKSFVGIANNENVLIEGIFKGYTLEDCNIISPSKKVDKYVDEEANIEFEIPNGWIEKELSEEREYIKTKFVREEENGLAILYGSTDIWSQMSEADKILYDRTSIDNTVLTKTDVAEMYGVHENKVETISINNIEYYKCVVEIEEVVEAMEIKYDMTILLRITNGWMFVFQYNGKNNTNSYQDFVYLIENIKYK